jgi:uncharacterized membrane protein
MRPPPWLGTETDAWQRDGLITDEQRRAILARYEPEAGESQRAATMLVWLALLMGGVGVTVLLAWNWTAIPQLAKILLTFGSVAASYGAAAIAARGGHQLRAERLAFFGALISGAALFVSTEIVHMDADHTSLLLLWAIVIAATGLLVSSALTAAAGAFVITWWMLVTAGSVPGPWWFLLVWPMLALTIERDRNRVVAGAVALAFGFWAFFVTLSVWGEAGGPPVAGFVVALLSGAWLDALAHGPIERRPEFASVTPALAVIFLSLVWLLPSDFHRELRDWHMASGSVWPVFVLIASLVVMTVRTLAANRQWRSRPMALVLVASIWILAWVLLPGAFRSGNLAQWTWTAVFSATMVLVGTSAVREAAATRDRGMLTLGLLSVLTFVVVRVIDNSGGVLVQALLLLTMAAVLWWLARMWSRGKQGAAR